MKLYEIAALIEQAITPPEGEEFNPEALDALKVKFEEKVEACIAYIKNLKSDEDALDAEIKRLQARKHAVGNHRKGLSGYVKAEIERLGRTSINLGVHKARIAKSPLSVIVEFPDKVDPDFKELRTQEFIDKKAIIAHIKDTGEIPAGVEMVQGTHLRVS